MKVAGAIISGDAHFIMPESVKQIVDAGADYLLAVKDNQLTLHAEMQNYFEQAMLSTQVLRLFLEFMNKIF